MALDGRVAIVTGGGQGIGRGICLRLARDGAAVGVADVNRETASAVVDEIRRDEGNAYAVEMDVAEEESVDRGVAEIRRQLGEVGVLVNNAGIFRETPFPGLRLDHWHQQLSIMLTGPLLCARAVVRDMIKQKWGRIVNMASVMSFVAYGSDAGYCAAKTGLLGLTRSLAADLAPHGVNVNAVCPGNIQTSMLEDVGRAVEKRDGLPAGQFMRTQAGNIPQGRFGSPDDIAGIVSFLCDDDSAYVTGQSLHVNGGKLLRGDWRRPSPPWIRRPAEDAKRSSPSSKIDR